MAVLCTNLQVCSAAVGLMGDLCRALGSKVLPYCDKVMMVLLENLAVSRSLFVIAPPLIFIILSLLPCRITTCIGVWSLRFCLCSEILLWLLDQNSAVTLKLSSIPWPRPPRLRWTRWVMGSWGPCSQLHDWTFRDLIFQNDYDMVDYLNELREGCLEAYTGIVQGLKADNEAAVNG